MKSILLIFSVLFSCSAFADAYWTCQCFENMNVNDAVGGVEVGAQSLGGAQKAALKTCKTSIYKRTTVTNCLRFTGRNDSAQD